MDSSHSKLLSLLRRTILITMTEAMRAALIAMMLCTVMVAWTITLVALVAGCIDVVMVGSIVTVFTIYATWRIP